MVPTVTHLTSRQVFGIFVQIVHVGAERLEVGDDKLLPEGLGEQNDVALDASRTGDEPKTLRFVLREWAWPLSGQAQASSHTSE